MKMSRQENTVIFGPEIQNYIVSKECACGCHHTDRKETQKMSYRIGGHTHIPYAHTLMHTRKRINTQVCMNTHIHTQIHEYTHTRASIGDTTNLGERDAGQHSEHSICGHN